MCQMSMKLPAMFDQNPPHILNHGGKTHSDEKWSQTLTLSSNVTSLTMSLDLCTNKMTGFELQTRYPATCKSSCHSCSHGECDSSVVTSALVLIKEYCCMQQVKRLAVALIRTKKQSNSEPLSITKNIYTYIHIYNISEF